MISYLTFTIMMTILMTPTAIIRKSNSIIHLSVAN